MLAKYRIHLKRIDMVDKKLTFFCLMAKGKLTAEFRVLEGGINFYMSLGMTDDFRAYIDIHFETNLDADLVVFTKEISSISLGSVVIVPAEARELRDAQNVERAKIERQLRDLFPLVLEALNTFRSACRIALFRESVAGDVLVQDVLATQGYLGFPTDQSLQEVFSGEDTEFLFGAFANLNLASFSGDAIIEYDVSDTSNNSLGGQFQGRYDGLHSVGRFSEKLDEIQKLVDSGWSIKDELLLASLESLYSNNYRMAVFNAATALELIVTQFWEEKQNQLAKGTRQDQERVAKLKKEMKDKQVRGVEAILQVVLPKFVDRELVATGNLNRCADAWGTRNRLAHPYVQIKEGKGTQVASTEAWKAVASIITLIENIEKLQP